MSHYFLPRWSLFLSALNNSLATGIPFNQSHTAEQIFKEVEEPFTLDTTVFPTSPQGNETSQTLYFSVSLLPTFFHYLSVHRHGWLKFTCEKEGKVMVFVTLLIDSIGFKLKSTYWCGCSIYIYFSGDSIAIATDIHARWRSHFVARRPLRRFRHYRGRATLGILPPRSRVFSLNTEVA